MIHDILQKTTILVTNSEENKESRYLAQQNTKQKIIWKNLSCPNTWCTYKPGLVHLVPVVLVQTNVPYFYLLSQTKVRRPGIGRYLSVHNVLAARGEVLPVEARPQLAVHLLLHAAPHAARRVRRHRPGRQQMILLFCLVNCKTVLGIQDPKPDPHVFWSPGSGSISQRCGSWSGSDSGSFPFLINVLSGLK